MAKYAIEDAGHAEAGWKLFSGESFEPVFFFLRVPLEGGLTSRGRVFSSESFP